MIVSCPSCNARYKIDPAKIKGRGAKITCPRCKQKFVVYKDDEGPEAADNAEDGGIADRDFSEVGVTWIVRNTVGLTFELHTLATLVEYLDSGKVEDRDSLSYDGRNWVPIDTIGDLEAYFEETWRRAERGEIRSTVAGAEVEDEDEDEDESDAPTTIMRHGSSLMDDIRRAVHDAATPQPVRRVEGPGASAPRPEPEPEPVRHQHAGSVGTPPPPALRGSAEALEAEKRGLYVDDPNAGRVSREVATGTGTRPDPFDKLKDQAQPKDEGGGSGGLILVGAVLIVFLIVAGVAAAAMQGLTQIPGISPPPAGEQPAAPPATPAPPPQPVDDAPAGDEAPTEADAPAGDAAPAEATDEAAQEGNDQAAP